MLGRSREPCVHVGEGSLRSYVELAPFFFCIGLISIDCIVGLFFFVEDRLVGRPTPLSQLPLVDLPLSRSCHESTYESSSLRCVSAAEHQTAEQYSKTGRTKPRKHLPRSALS